MRRFLLPSLASGLAAAVLAARFPNCPTCASVSEAAPGHSGYNGGRWRVVEAFGITSQLTNADAVVEAASSLVDTGTHFVCPLIRALGRRRPSYRRMRDAVSRGQPRATSLRACARSTRVSSAIIAARGRSNPRLTNWLRRQTRVLCPSAD
jgi:hypothetical protein